MVADHLGAELDEVRETYEKRATDRRLEVASGVIEPGTVGAVRFETIGVVAGREAIVIEHVNRMAPDLAPDWTVPDVDGTYRITVAGDPDLACDLRVGPPGGASAAGMVATAMRVVNAIPHVVAAPPGIVSATDLPLTLPLAAFDP
jgi:2,4-diaminopentanoate dehydrogenase